MNDNINYLVIYCTVAGAIIFWLGMIGLLISAVIDIVWNKDDATGMDEDYQEAQKLLDLLRSRRGKGK